MSDSRLQLKATKILHRNNAQEIRKALADLEEHRAEFATPAEAVAEGCSAIAEAWTALLGDDDPLIESCVLTPERLIERVKEVGSLKNLGAQLELEPAEIVAWLNGLISAGLATPIAEVVR